MFGDDIMHALPSLMLEGLRCPDPSAQSSVLLVHVNWKYRSEGT